MRKVLFNALSIASIAAMILMVLIATEAAISRSIESAVEIEINKQFEMVDRPCDKCGATTRQYKKVAEEIEKDHPEIKYFCAECGRRHSFFMRKFTQ